MEVGPNFTTGVKQEDKVTVTDDADGDYTVTINGVDFTHAAVGQTKAQIASDLNALIDTYVPGWVPVTCIYAAGNEYVTLRAKYEGCPFTIVVEGNLTVTPVTANSGDQVEVIRRIVNYSDAVLGTGDDVYLSRFNAPVFDDDFADLDIYGATFYADFDAPGFVGPATGIITLIADYAEKAILDSIKVTVELV